jgi:hypothetical protein
MSGLLTRRNFRVTSDYRGQGAGGAGAAHADAPPAATFMFADAMNRRGGEHKGGGGSDAGAMEVLLRCEEHDHAVAGDADAEAVGIHRQRVCGQDGVVPIGHADVAAIGPTSDDLCGQDL